MPICRPATASSLSSAGSAATTSCSFSQGRPTGEGQQDVALRGGDRHRRADRPAALAHDRPGHRGAGEQDADRAAVDDAVVDEQPRRSGSGGPGGEPSDERQPGEGRVAPRHEAVDGERPGVGQQDTEGGVVDGRHPDDRERGVAAQHLEVEGPRLHAGHGRGPDADGGQLLDATRRSRVRRDRCSRGSPSPAGGRTR